MVEPELDLVAHELSAGVFIASTEECFCECTVPPGEECYTCYTCDTAVCDAGGGTECICSTCYCDCAIAQNDGNDGDDDDGGNGNTGDDGANESV